MTLDPGHEPKGRLGMGLWFYPRGGSSQVVRYLSSELAAAGWDVTLVAGSLGHPGDATHAATFFAGLNVHAVDYTPAADAHARGEDAMGSLVPMHASYEDRADVPDRFLASVEPAVAEHLVRSWARLLPGRFVEQSEVFHLHHLTPLHEAVGRLRPQAPIVAHLHGTELKFLEALAQRAPVQRWPHAAFWERRLRRIAGRCQRVLVTSPADRDAAPALLEIDPGRIEWIPNGVDTALFRPRALSAGECLALLRRWLVDDPRGWDETEVPGTIRYGEADLQRLVDPATGDLRPLLMYVGRFTAVKRIPLLLRAYARARPRFGAPAFLVVWGGHPGELEGEHPRAVAARLGLDDVFLVGWRGHDELPLGLAAADLLLMPSVKESFGQTAIEAMACGVPVVATRSGGPPSFINTEPARPTGWLVEPDDEGQLADALVEAVNRPDERRRRGERSLAVARARFSWTSLVPRFEAVYENLRSGRPVS